jgi:hypothetical protein
MFSPLIAPRGMVHAAWWESCGIEQEFQRGPGRLKVGAYPLPMLIDFSNAASRPLRTAASKPAARMVSIAAAVVPR